MSLVKTDSYSYSSYLLAFLFQMALLTAGVLTCLTRGDPIACAYVPVPIACFTILIPISISIGRLLSWKSLSLS